ncbi:type III-B CRISPR module RAMP protein Cmr4 [Paenibacillus sp. UMB4589-SE434]|uniref:type III-B CRISPR module RAMP protein Cmr4 n=1 Tax=Paenibacillus sp. UMB4589-SE434 TaxID=3046314 RepID=UPI00254B2753|nr:type III-B CRISPR module RAMP protein Cmr4 [Paenibacillus sp. UMB4589-SE434]MDK8180625.1 type III-B CRISPR module RAMP protein Cmr4 [Paenibacillus sp. UMB4589-SE434]
MSETCNLYFIHCLTPLHIGAGEGAGIIDMPIIREKLTGWPFVPGSSVKGVQRDYFRHHSFGQADQEWLETLFGSDLQQSKEAADTVAGAIALSDARMLAFPVASSVGTFAYVSCPLAIKRLLRDMGAANLSLLPELDWANIVSVLEKEDRALVGFKDAVILHHNPRQAAQVTVELDEFQCKAEVDAALGLWVDQLAAYLFVDEFSKQMFRERFVLLPDEAFQYMVRNCCEIIPRIRLQEETKTTVRGALWSEEYIPAEAVLYGLTWCDHTGTSQQARASRQFVERLSQAEQVVQMGANASVGKGRVRFRVVGGGE